jgi:hypothetical protein
MPTTSINLTLSLQFLTSPIAAKIIEMEFNNSVIASAKNDDPPQHLGNDSDEVTDSDRRVENCYNKLRQVNNAVRKAQSDPTNKAATAQARNQLEAAKLDCWDEGKPILINYQNQSEKEISNLEKQQAAQIKTREALKGTAFQNMDWGMITKTLTKLAWEGKLNKHPDIQALNNVAKGLIVVGGAIGSVAAAVVEFLAPYLPKPSFGNR